MAAIKRTLVSFLLVVLIALFSRHVLKLIRVLGIFTFKHDHEPGPCRFVEGTETGGEDFHLLPDGFTFISTGLTWPYVPYNSSVRKGIYGFDFKNLSGDLVWLPMQGDFNQESIMGYQGVSAWRDKSSGAVTLFVIAHRKDKDTVEHFRFDMEAMTLHHKKTIEDPYFSTLNDLVATGPDSFYATNDGCLRSPTTRNRLILVEIIMQWYCGSIIYYDGKSARTVGEGYTFPNGIQVSSDGRILYVAHYGELNLMVFKRNQDNSIQELRRIDVHLNPDNINIDGETGDIWAVGPYRIPDMSVTPPTASTSVLRIQVNNRDIIHEFYSNSGKDLSFGSVAVRHGKHLLIGTISHKVLLCELKYLPD